MTDDFTQDELGTIMAALSLAVNASDYTGGDHFKRKEVSAIQEKVKRQLDKQKKPDRVSRLDYYEKE